MKRREFLNKTVLSTSAIVATPLLQYCTGGPASSKTKAEKELKISLAQWSLHRQFFDGNLDPIDFSKIAMEIYGIDAVEYVNAFYVESAGDETFWNGLRQQAEDAGVRSLLIMVDDEGDLGVADDLERIKAVQNHYKWIHAAKILGCHSIRVNAFGESDRELYRAAIIDGMGQLADYAGKEEINVIIENHGLFSSDGKLIAGIVEEVDKPNFGTFPDFGNWCLSAKWGTTQFECDKEYDRYQGVSEFLPYAKAVSAKSYNFNQQGEDTKIDYYKMLKIVKESAYDGYIGIEYEGEILSEHEGILSTRKLMEKVWESI